MIIGIDLDNTIIQYDYAFRYLSVRHNLITDLELSHKSKVKQSVLSNLGNEAWTYLQGLVYGDGIMSAVIYENVLNFLKVATGKADVYIISHKTKYNQIGDKVDLRHSAICWLREKKVIGNSIGQIKEKNVYFCNTRDEKIQKIRSLNCTHFIDDLFEVLIHNNLPNGVKKYLFGYYDIFGGNKKIMQVRNIIYTPNWCAIQDQFNCEYKK